MIGDVNDAGSGGIRDAVMGALQRSVRQRRHLLESRRLIHDRMTETASDAPVVRDRRFGR
jgi:hypothetical protein